jgi:hypothetical protein
MGTESNSYDFRFLAEKLRVDTFKSTLGSALAFLSHSGSSTNSEIESISSGFSAWLASHDRPPHKSVKVLP